MTKKRGATNRRAWALSGQKRAALRAHRMVERIGNFQVDSEILRGIPLRRALWQGGRLFRRSPLDLSEQQRANLWQRSRQGRELVAFKAKGLGQHGSSSPGERMARTMCILFGSLQKLICFRHLKTLGVPQEQLALGGRSGEDSGKLRPVGHSCPI